MCMFNSLFQGEVASRLGVNSLTGRYLLCSVGGDNVRLGTLGMRPIWLQNKQR